MISKRYGVVQKRLFLFSFLFISLAWLENASATVTVLGVTGATSFTLADGTNNAIINGAHALPVSSSGDNTNTIDSCAEAGASSLQRACSFASIYPSLTLSIALKTDTKALMVSTSRVTGRTSGASSDNITPSSTVTVGGDGTFTFPVQWQTLCGLYSTSSGTCTDYIVSTFDIYVTSANGSVSEKVTINLNMRYVDATAAAEGTYTDCASVAQTEGGLCSFGVLPGDEKIYLTNIAYPTSFPTSKTTSFSYTKAVFFYRASTAPGNDVGLGDDYYIVDIDTAKSPPLRESRLTGITNGINYCFAMASMDSTGLVSYLTPNGSRHCAKPEEVWGILDDKKCFIATAAWGSEMDSHVEEFRAFRNRVLLQTSWGKKFVNWYYSHSPAAAKVIRESELLRASARTGLWPLLLFIRASAAIGFQTALALVLLMFTALSMSFFWWFKRRRQVMRG